MSAFGSYSDNAYQTMDFCDDGSAVTAPVGAYHTNPYGLHDMHGNVWEWTEDCYEDRCQGAPQDGMARVINDCGRRVFRGGSWLNNPQSLRATYRSNSTPGYRNNNTGFRVSRTLNP